MFQSHDRSHDDLAISVGAQHQWFPEQQRIFDEIHEIRLGVNYDLGWIHLTIDKHWSLMAHTRKSTIHHLSRCHRRVSKHRDSIFEAFLSTNWHEPFVSDWQIVWAPKRTNFFDSQMFMQYWMYAGPTNA